MKRNWRKLQVEQEQKIIRQIEEMKSEDMTDEEKNIITEIETILILMSSTIEDQEILTMKDTKPVQETELTETFEEITDAMMITTEKLNMLHIVEQVQEQVSFLIPEKILMILVKLQSQVELQKASVMH